MNAPDTLISGFVSKSKSIFGFIPKTTWYGLKLAKLGQLSVLYASVANGKYFGYTWP